MQTATQRIITAFFRSQSDAEKATRQLEDAGIPKGSIRLVAAQEPDSVAAMETNRTAGFWAPWPTSSSRRKIGRSIPRACAAAASS